ncbi:MAG: ferrochelatase [Acidobacteria bacterium]|nr:ferrochelatase [Acidobacteriota bacterium]
MTAPAKHAVLLLAHGTPASVDDVPEFLLRVTGGRVLPQEAIEEVKHRYAAIGRSPLTELTLKQGELLAERMGLPVYVGMRNWHPLVSQALAAIEADGVRHAVVICLAPHNSRTSVGLYRKSLADAAASDITFDFVESWHDHPLLVQAFAEKLIAARKRNNGERGGEPAGETQASIRVIFTAHSVPERTVREGDPYELQARETAALVASSAGLEESEWRFAFQSQGMSGGPWLGPTVEETILEMKRAGDRSILIQPIGFLSDHVEVLYDIDIHFKQFAKSHGIGLLRTESLNDSTLLISALHEIVESRMSASASVGRQ